MTTPPLVSVILSVHNGAADLPKAIDTIMAQTFRDFELIAINNGSTDASAAILDSLRDPRVRVVHQEDRGLPAALNGGIALSRGRYIARQDHDDWAKPSRLEKQLAFLAVNPNCALVGTRAEIWIGDRKTDRVHDHPCDNAALQFELMFDNPFVHSSIMARKAALEAVGGYSTDRSRQPPEDFELWSRLARRYEVANLPERLTIYREVPKSMSRIGDNPFSEKLVLISSENLAHASGKNGPDQRHRDVAALTHGVFDVVSADSDIEQLCGLVRETGNYIVTTAPGADIRGRVQARIATLRRQHKHLQLKRSLGVLWPLIYRTRRIWRLNRLKDRITRLVP